VLAIGSFVLLDFSDNPRSRERKESMAKDRRSRGEKRERWRRVTQGSAQLIADIPHLRETIDELREVARELEKLEGQQAHHLTEARLLTPKIRALAKRADHLRGLVGASLRGKHGFDSRILTLYGFKPREWVKKDFADLALDQEREEREAPPGEKEE
jgi:hypothetical protein